MKKGFQVLVAIKACKRFVCTSLYLILCFFTVSAQVKLSYNPELGTKYEYLMDMVQNIKQNVMGQEIPMETKMTITHLMEIKEKTSQEIKVQMTYQSFLFAVTSPMMKMTYDSKSSATNSSEMDKMMEKMFSTMIGKPFIIVIEPNGTVKSVSGMDEIIKNMVGAISADGQVAAQMGAQMSQQFSDESMKNSFSQTFNVYPDHAIKVGDTWDKSTTIPMNNMNLSYKSNNTLKEISSNKATIAVTGDINMDTGEGKLTGTQTGSFIADAKTGLPVTSEITQNMKGTIKAQGMEIQMEMTSKATTSAKAVK